MNINLGMLSNKDKLEISGTVSFDDTYLSESEIQKLDNVKYEGYLFQNDLDEYWCRINVKGQMMIPDSVTTELIALDFDFDIDDEITENLIKEQNMLDIMELLWQNIVLEVPIRYTLSDADNLKGDNWKVIDESYEETVDPRMQKLNDYFNEGGE